MLKITPKIADVDIANDISYVYLGQHGFPILISRLKDIVSNMWTAHILQMEVLRLAETGTQR